MPEREAQEAVLRSEIELSSPIGSIISGVNDYRIFADQRLDVPVLEVLRSGVAPHELILPAKAAASMLVKAERDPAFGRAEIAFGQPDLESIYESEKLKWIHLSSAGYTRYDTPEFRQHAKDRGLLVTNSSEVYAEACAEQVLAFMLGQSRQIPQSLPMRVGNGSPEWLVLRNSCRPLKGGNVLILGYGTIAKRLVEMLKPFEMEIVAMRRQPRGDEGLPVVTLEELPAALAAADHVVNILPDNAASIGFFDTDRFAQMKDGAVFYNIGRGTTVDQLALADALRAGNLEAAWLDVTDPEPLPDEHPLWALDNCFITPHTAGGFRNESLAMVNHFLRNLDRFTKGEDLLNRVI